MLVSSTSFKESMMCELSEHSESTLVKINDALEDVKKDGKQGFNLKFIAQNESQIYT
jgi:hypothetical protein